MQAQGEYDKTEYANREREVAKLTDRMYDLSNSYDDLAKKAVYHNSPFTKFGEGLEKVGTMAQNFGNSLVSVGDGLTQIGTVATASGGLFAKTAIDFEKGLIGVQKTTNASAEQMKVFEKEIRNMATTMPIAHGELTELASIAGQLGVKQNDIAEFTRVMAMMGTATSLSATEASEAFARFGNITGTGVSTINNLGSALVHLGNNMATTESEIMHMSQQLAGTLTTVGVGEADILALSASMSSLGITAERGASSVSKFFVDMSTAVSEGGESVQAFADVAGMTGDAFSNLFREDAMGAFTAFIDGLAQIDANGGDVIKTLDDMGIKEVRLRDTLLRLAQGHDVLAEGIRLSNEAYQDGTKHLSEYELMASSTASQWEIAKNKFMDVAISLGQALLPAIMDVIDNSDGLVQTGRDLAEWFTNLDDGVKSTLVKFGAFSVAMGPIISGFGNLVVAGGGLLSLFGKMSKAIGLLGTFFVKDGGIADDILVLGKNAGTASQGMGLLTKAIGLINNPIGLTLAGVTALAGAFVYLNRDALEASNAIREFPEIKGISVEQAQNLRDSAEELDSVASAIGNIKTAGDISYLGKDIGTVASKIKELNTEKIDALTESFNKLPKNVQENLSGVFQETVKNINAQIDEAERAVNRLNEFSQKEKLTEGEQFEASSLATDLIDDFARANSDSHEQYQQTKEYLLADIDEMGMKRLNIRQKNDSEYLNYVKKAEKDALQALWDIYSDPQSTMAEEEYNRQRLSIQKSYGLQREQAVKNLLKTENELWERMYEHEYDPAEKNRILQQHKNWLEEMAKEYGMTVEQLQDYFNEVDFSEIPAKLIDPMAQVNDTIEDSAKKWNSTMNNFASTIGKSLEDITFEDVIAHTDEFVDALRKAGMTWQDLELLEKEGKIDSNTKEFLQDVMMSAEVWQSLNYDEKLVAIGVDPEGKAQFEELLNKLGVEWEQLDPRIHELMVEGHSAQEATQMAIQEMINWDNVTPEDKQLIVDSTIADEKVREAINNQQLWNNSEFMTKLMQIDTNAPDAEQQLTNLLAQWGIVPSGESKLLNTETNASETQGILGNLVGYWLLSLLGLGTAELNTDTNAPDTQGKVEALGEAGNAVDGTTVGIDTNTNAPETQGKVASLGDKANAVGKITPNITTSTNAPDTTGLLATTESQAKSLDAQSPNIHVGATDNFSGVFRSAWAEHNAINGYQSYSYHTTVFDSIGTRYFKHGTNNHPGGLAILGDGGRREPFLTPDGMFGISPAKDTLYNLPMGTKVWSSISKFKGDASTNDLLKQIMHSLPKFATGTKNSFLDDYKISVPKTFDKEVPEINNSQTINMEINLQVIGSSITRSQADGIIEPLIESAKRYSKRTGTNVNVGGIA